MGISLDDIFKIIKDLAKKHPEMLQALVDGLNAIIDGYANPDITNRMATYRFAGEKLSEHTSLRAETASRWLLDALGESDAMVMRSAAGWPTPTIEEAKRLEKTLLSIDLAYHALKPSGPWEREISVILVAAAKPLRIRSVETIDWSELPHSVRENRLTSGTLSSTFQVFPPLPRREGVR